MAAEKRGKGQGAPLDAEILAMFQRVPVALLEKTCLQLLQATRRIRLSKDEPEGTEEPDWNTRLKVWQTIIEQRAGAAGTRRPVESATDQEAERPRPGLLRKGPQPPPE